MGYDSIRYAGAYLGYGIHSERLINYGKFSCESAACKGILKQVTDKLDSRFKSFLKAKLNDSVPEEYSIMKFVIGYDKLIAKYEVSPFDYPDLMYGYNVAKFVKRPKNLNLINEFNFPQSFPKNCADLLAEFLSRNRFEYKEKEGKAIDVILTESDIKKDPIEFYYGLYGFIETC